MTLRRRGGDGGSQREAARVPRRNVPSVTYVSGMPKHSQRFGFDLPEDFPLDQLELVHARVSDGGIYAANLPLWRHWAGGCNATMYRFIAADDANREWVDTY